jgi:peptidoglycan/xylan/chitin deacetylase (PgdA/CDA1 family)
MRMESVRHALSGYRPDRLAYRGTVRARMCAERSFLAVHAGISPERSAAKRGRILAYHSVGTPKLGVNDVRPRDFERHLQVAIDEGWSFATPAQVLAEPDKQQLALTFDDGLTSVLSNALPVLRHHGVPATAFVVTGWADHPPPGFEGLVLDWPGVSALGEGGLALASHSVTHPDFGQLDPAEARRELEESRDRMDRMLGIATDEFAIPLGQSANWTDAAGQAAAGAGYRTVYAQSVNTRPPGTIPRTFITRIDKPMLFRAALAGAYDNWEEWY